MAKVAIVFAFLLIAVGLGGYLLADPDPETGVVSVTALIPAIFGVALLICGLLALKESLRKHAMHLASLFALLGAVGAGIRIPKLLGPGTELALYSHIATTVLCLLFVILAVRSFILARSAIGTDKG